MEAEIGDSRCIIDELHSSDNQGDQMAGESGFTRIIIDELHSWDIQGDQMVGKGVLLQGSIMNFILGYPRRSNGR